MFVTTRWSLIVAARGDSPPAREALSELCRAYWYPLYAYIRRKGHTHAEAEDLTQEFLARLLERDDLAGVDPARGRFRSFLLAACNHFLSNRRDHDRALKRGGGQQPLPLDFGAAEQRYNAEPGHEETAERLFERRWALALLDRVLDRLRQEYATGGKGELFEKLKGRLAGDSGASYADVATDLTLTEGAVKVAAHRMRLRYRDLLRDEIAQTLDDPTAVDDEIRSLFTALAG